MARFLLAVIFAASGHGGQAHLGTAVTATFPHGSSHGVACVVHRACHGIRR